MSVSDWLMNASSWLQVDDRGNMLLVVLAFALLLELSIRVVRRFLADRRVRNAAAENTQRVTTRMGRPRPV